VVWTRPRNSSGDTRPARRPEALDDVRRIATPSRKFVDGEGEDLAAGRAFEPRRPSYYTCSRWFSTTAVVVCLSQLERARKTGLRTGFGPSALCSREGQGSPPAWLTSGPGPHGGKLKLPVPTPSARRRGPRRGSL